MSRWNGKETLLMTRPTGSNDPSQDPLDALVQLWGVRLWIAVALLVITVAVANYLLHHFA